MFCAALQLHNVLCRRALLALHDVELHAVTLGQALEALCLDRRMMDEAVLLTVLGRDEAKALGVVKPLDRASGACHFLLLELGVIGVGTCRTTDYGLRGFRLPAGPGCRGATCARNDNQ